MATNKKRKKKAPRMADPNSKRSMEKSKKAKKFDATSIVMLCILFAVVAIIMVLIVAAIGPGSGENNQSSQQEASVVSVSSEEAGSDLLAEQFPELDAAVTYTADIVIKDHGTIKVKLDQSAAPVTVRNFVGLANSGFYNGLTFHRIIEGFMMQGGDPNGTGTGGSAYNIKGEFSANGYKNPLSHTRGAISMARNSFDMNSASSQFFICQNDSHVSSLDGNYAAFGYVTEGMEIVDRICTEAKPIDNNGTIPASEQPVINSVKVIG